MDACPDRSGQHIERITINTTTLGTEPLPERGKFDGCFMRLAMIRVTGLCDPSARQPSALRVPRPDLRTFTREQQ